MYKTGRSTEKLEKRIAELAALEPNAIPMALVERAKQAALAMAVALLEQDAEALCGAPYACEQDGQGYRGGHEQTSVVVEGAK